MSFPAETSTRHSPSKSVMMCRAALNPLLLLSLCVPLQAQFGSPFPGGSPYPGAGGPTSPGGGIGGLPLPGRRRNAQNGPVETMTGTLRRVSTSQFVLDPGDDRNITVSIERTTKFVGTSGGTARLGDFDIGDQVSIDALRDTQNYYHAQRVTLQHKVASTAPAPEGNASQGQPAPGATSSTDDPDRPRLQRAPQPESRGTTPTAQITAGDPTVEAPLKPIPREADDPGPPKLRRGGTARVDNTPPAGAEPASAAAVRPTLKAEEINGVTRRQAPPAVSSEPTATRAGASSGLTTTDAVIMGAREAATSFSETLPNYVVKQFTTRYQTDSAHGDHTAWQALDVVTADVVYEGGKESYKNILVNGKAPKDAIEKTGTWSTGEFATILQQVLAPYTDADFRGKRSTTIVNRPAFRYDFTVEQPRSAWHVIASAQSYIPGFTGSIWIDKENFRVLRIEQSARDMPKEFPLDRVESVVDYDYVLLGDQKYLLPVHSESLSCVRGTSDCSRNTIDFRNYRKFGADTSITFDKN